MELRGFEPLTPSLRIIRRLRQSPWSALSDCWIAMRRSVQRLDLGLQEIDLVLR